MTVCEGAFVFTDDRGLHSGGHYLMYLCTRGRVLYGRCNTKSMVRRLTVRTVHVWIVNICVCGSMVVGEIFVGPRLSVNTSRACVWVCVCGRIFLVGSPYNPQNPTTGGTHMGYSI